MHTPPLRSQVFTNDPPAQPQAADWLEREDTLPKTNMDTQNHGLENVTPFKTGNFGYLC